MSDRFQILKTDDGSGRWGVICPDGFFPDSRLTYALCPTFEAAVARFVAALKTVHGSTK